MSEMARFSQHDAPGARFPRHEVCPLCSSKLLARRFTVAGFTIIRCNACSLQLVGERLTAEDLNSYYTRVEDDYIYASPENLANLNHYYTRLKRLVEERVRPGRVLDVGCSGGYFLDTMTGWERYGVELSPAYAEVARAKYGSNVTVGGIESCAAPDGFFDCIALQDVLDHTTDPVATLRRCAELLRPGGLIAIKVHDISCLYARVTGSRFYALIPPYHLFYFDRTTLALAMQMAGLSMTLATHVSHRLWLKTIPYRLSRGRTSGPWFRLFQALERSPRLGQLTVRKNLHDIITVLGTRHERPAP